MIGDWPAVGEEFQAVVTRESAFRRSFIALILDDRVKMERWLSLAMTGTMWFRG